MLFKFGSISANKWAITVHGTRRKPFHITRGANRRLSIAEADRHRLKEGEERLFLSVVRVLIRLDREHQHRTLC